MYLQGGTFSFLPIHYSNILGRHCKFPHTRTRRRSLNFLFSSILPSMNFQHKPSFHHHSLYFHLQVFTYLPYTCLTESIIHVCDQFWSSRFHLSQLVIIHTLWVNNEDTFHNLVIKLEFLDICNCPNSEDLEFIVAYHFPPIPP